MAEILWLLGYPDQAEQWSAAALALAEALTHPFTLGYACWVATVLHRFQRDIQRTSERAMITLRLGTAQGYEPDLRRRRRPRLHLHLRGFPFLAGFAFGAGFSSAGCGSAPAVP